MRGLNMKKCIRYAFLLLLPLMAIPAAAKEQTMSIQVRQGQLRSTPSYMSRIVKNVDYATRVTVLEEKGSWVRVRLIDGSQEGWLHAASLTKKKLKLSSGKGDASTTVSTEEQALAGKGFNSDVEAKFKKDNSEIDFTWVDKMEKIKIKTSVISRFLKNGDIKPAKAGA
jgi:uncharacterized protein YgiM (DUF1202 family)